MSVVDGTTPAMRRAFRAAVLRHRAAGVPMVIWEDDQVVEIDPYEIELPEDDAP